MLAYFSRGYDVIIIQSDLIFRQKVRLGFFGNSLPPLLWVSWLTDLICGSLLYPLDYDYELISVWYFYYSAYFLFFSFLFFDHFHNWAQTCATRFMTFYLHFHDWALSSWFGHASQKEVTVCPQLPQMKMSEYYRFPMTEMSD